MLKITNVNVYGLEESIIASGFPLRAIPYTETEFHDNVINLIGYLEMGRPIEDTIADKHFKRAIKLGNTKSNSGHPNYLSGILVQFNVIYPEYWSPEFQRYHFAQIVSSSSKMHCLKDMNLDEFVNQYVLSKTLSTMKQLQQAYKEDPSYENYMTLISNCPLGLEKIMRISTNYLQLVNIFNQRHNHKLKEWHIFCDWILELPYFKELTGIEK